MDELLADAGFWDANSYFQRCMDPNPDIRFIDDWYSYHDLLGEVHCGTNARRSPFSQARWWEHKPDGGFDL